MEPISLTRKLEQLQRTLQESWRAHYPDVQIRCVKVGYTPRNREFRWRYGGFINILGNYWPECVKR